MEEFLLSTVSPSDIFSHLWKFGNCSGYDLLVTVLCVIQFGL